MPVKNTMNKLDVVKFHQLLGEELPLSEISEIMMIEVATLECFTPAYLAQVKKDQNPYVEAEVPETRTLKPKLKVKKKG